MIRLQVDSGLETFQLPGGTLQFNPADPMLFVRLEQLQEKLSRLNGDPETMDREVKKLLDWLLGAGNDVDKALCGVSLFAVGSNGNSVLQNFLEALTPILKAGAEQCAESC